jgi:hypothetical protein
VDPITLIATALAAGVSAAVKDTAGQAIKDAYESLKGLIRRKFGSKPIAEAVEQHEAAPDAGRESLKTALADAGADRDEEILAAAKKVLELADPEGAAKGKYNVTISGSKGVVVGDNATVTQTFNE